ncbi:class I adenylate-forming enzyme family protein [Minwuia thermotolerans]|nr:AMP-binding protein [Minwuia thermotolerans]
MNPMNPLKSLEIDVENFHNRRNDQRWNRVSVGDVLERFTWNEPDKTALIATLDATINPAHARLSYRQANDLMNRISNGLLSLNLKRGTVVALLCDNSNEAWLSKVAIGKAGMVAAPVNAMMAPDVITDALGRVGAACAIADATLWEKLSGAFDAAGVKPVMLVGGPEDGDVPNFDQFIEKQTAEEPDVRIHGDDIWQILFTSGTTAAPKAVMISHTYTYMAAYSYALPITRGLAHESDLRQGVFTPMTYHIGDQICIFAPLVCGGTVVMGRKPEGHNMASAITRERITCLFGGSPQFVEDLIRACHENPKSYDLSSLTVMYYGWAPLAPGSLAAFRKLCAPNASFFEIIGQTECVPCHRFFIDRHLDVFMRNAPAVNHVGLPSPVLASTIMDEEGNDLRGQPGVAGEAVYRSPAIFSGYYKDEEATRESLKFGWFRSGDSFAFDETDELRIMVDRYKDIVKSGGENVSSIRVESVLQQHPAIERAAVIGLPDDRWGEAVTACVIVADGQDMDEKAVIAFCRERLAGFETPKRIVPVKEFPTTVGGKILKYKLRQQLS